MSISIDTYKEEIDRAFRVLGERGLEQNAIDICGWFNDGHMSESEYQELRRYNRKVYSELPL